MDVLKERIAGYWTRRASLFAEQRRREYSSEKRGLWEAEFRQYLPKTEPLDVLDIGTGAGFFAFLLAKQGHRVTGIDLSEDMIRQAEAASARLGTPALFRTMDAEKPVFPSDSFDVIVTRNLTWALPHLPEAYQAWFSLLRPGGLLLNFDADYCRCVAEGKDMEHKLPPQHAHMNISPELLKENQEITLELSAYQSRRPQWDVGLLLSAGFERVSVDRGVWGRIYAEKDEFYNPVPIFAIAAYKTR